MRGVFAEDMAGAVWDLQRCTFCCSCGSLASTAGYSRVELSGVAGQSLRSGFPLGGLLKLSLRRRFVGKQLRNGGVTRFVLASRFSRV